jgi:hypothetical protein
MQANEHVGQVQPGKALPDLNRAFTDAGRKARARRERREADAPREAVEAMPRMPRRYGAGF